MTTERNVVDFKIHNLTEEQFQELKEAGQIDPNAIYCTPDETVANFEEINTQIEALKNKGGIPLLTPMWADHLLNDMSWLNADTFSWHSGDVYVAAYEHLASEMHTENLYAWAEEEGRNRYTRSATPSVGGPVYTASGSQVGTVESVGTDYIVFNGTTCPRNSGGDILGTNAETDTVDDITITFYRADDGHKICLPDQEANVQSLYEKTGVAWYYILDTANKQFKLPRTKHAFTGLRDSVGGYVEAGVPNITGYMTNILSDGYDNSSKTQALTAKTTSTNFYTPQSSGYGLRAESWTFDASNSNSIYGNSGTVQPPATQMYLYFYAGNFEQSAVEQTAGLNAELFNGKADRDLKNLPSNYDYVVASQEPTSANGYTWYKKYKSGWVEQGGRYANQSFTGGQATFTATLPIPVVDSSVIASPEYVSGDSVVVVTSWSTGTTANTTVERNTISSTLSTEASARWIVVGNAQ